MLYKQLLVLFILSSLSQVNAAELAMPKTASEISRALSQPKVVVEEFESKGFSQETKGFDDIINDLPSDLPKIGALIQFDFDSTAIKAESKPLLREYGRSLQTDLKEATLLIAGHTDDVGSAKYNLGLSLQRAQAIREFLVSINGVDNTHLLIKGFGEEQPIDTNTTEEGRALNR